MHTRLFIPNWLVDTLTVIGDRSVSASDVVKGYTQLGLDMFGDCDDIARQLNERVEEGFLTKTFTVLGFRYAIAPEILCRVSNPNSRQEWWNLASQDSLDMYVEEGGTYFVVNPT